MTIRQVNAELRSQLSTLYPEAEVESFSRMIFRHFLGMTPAQTHLSLEREPPVEIVKQIRNVIGELKKYRPIQYLLGETEFYGLTFDLTSDVLIPRPETEELVDWVLSECDANETRQNMLDVGTGSGCIAVALAANLPGASVWATDISEAALAVAKRNALKNNANVNFLLHDVLKDGLTGLEPASLDAIASNPPYVAPSEKNRMLPNVLDYEPHLALFAPESDPLIFYERIAAFGAKCLKNKGKIYFEINEAHSEQVRALLLKYHYANVVVRKDLCGKWRMAGGEKGGDI